VHALQLHFTKVKASLCQESTFCPFLRTTYLLLAKSRCADTNLSINSVVTVVVQIFDTQWELTQEFRENTDDFC